MSLKAESVRRLDATPSHLLTTQEATELFPGVNATLLSDTLKAATVKLGQFLGYSLEHRQIFARYSHWERSMELPIPRPMVPYSSELIDQVLLLDHSSTDGVPVVLTDAHFVDFDPPPPRVVFTGDVPEVVHTDSGVALPAQIQFQYKPLTTRDSRTLVLKDGLVLLMKTMFDRRDDPLALPYPWESTVADLRLLVV